MGLPAWADERPSSAGGRRQKIVRRAAWLFLGLCAFVIFPTVTDLLGIPLFKWPSLQYAPPALPTDVHAYMDIMLVFACHITWFKGAELQLRLFLQMAFHMIMKHHDFSLTLNQSAPHHAYNTLSVTGIRHIRAQSLLYLKPAEN